MLYTAILNILGPYQLLCKQSALLVSLRREEVTMAKFNFALRYYRCFFSLSDKKPSNGEAEESELTCSMFYLTSVYVCGPRHAMYYRTVLVVDLAVSRTETDESLKPL